MRGTHASFLTGIDHCLRDKILVKDLEVRSITGVDAWERAKKQTLILNICVYFNVGPSGETDALSDTVSYSTISKKVMEFVEKSEFKSLEALAAALCSMALAVFACEGLTLNIQKPRALLHASSAGIEMTRFREPKESEDILFIHDLSVPCIIGVNAWEREEKQIVLVGLKLHVALDQTKVKDTVPNRHNYRTIARSIVQILEDSCFKTVEALATHIAKYVIQICHVPKVTVLVEKPSALMYAKAAAIEITRTRDYFKEPNLRGIVISSGPIVTVFLGIGTNQGNRLGNIESAIALLESNGVKIVDTSFLYATAPMYVEDQPDFLNAVLKAQTTLGPEELLDLLKRIESDLGRDFGTIRNGPRPIDIDILYYNELELKTDRLIIPHPRIAEREFVLRPFIAGHMEHPGLFRTCHQLLALLKHAQNRPRVSRVFPVGDQLWDFQTRTFIMGILNVTPDSFSDGGQYLKLEDSIARAKEMVAEGADIIDIGGQSTRPNAVEVSEQEELNRVLPVIQGLRKAGITLPLSVDTYRSSVALASLSAGANLINDVSGGQRDPNMLSVMARARVPVCLMHMRGDSHTMMSLTDYGPDFIGSLKTALESICQSALNASLRRWHILLDPGIGFAKAHDQNYEILRNLSSLKDNLSPPFLIGVSRKKFITTTIDKPSSQSDFGSAAACCSAIAGGAALLRVHQVNGIKDVVSVADQCFKK